MNKSKITITSELRPCIVNGKKALFHRWTDRSEIVAPSYMVGGHGGGVVKDTFALVEFEDGVIKECSCVGIKFCDSPHRNYCFGGDGAK